MLLPRQPVPALSLPLAGGGTFDLARDHGERFTLLAFYRGLHCPICVAQLRELEAATPEFLARGVRPLAVSSDTADRAAAMAAKVPAVQLPVAYGLPLSEARAWGLYLSAGRGVTSAGIEEPALFSEPGLFIVRADGTLYFASVQTMPFARPAAAGLLKAVAHAIETDYPARGEHAGAV